jgi:hypothetical protein
MTSAPALWPFRIARAGGKVWLAVPATFAAVLAGLLLLPLAPGMPQSGQDESWSYALNEAVARHLVFGRDFIFTYGPFGSVETWLYHPATDALMLAGSALIAAALCAGFALLVWPRRIYLLLLLPIVVAEAGGGSVLTALPLLLLLVAFRLSSPRDSRLYLPQTGVTAVGVSVLSCAVGILPLIKGTYAIAAFLDGALAVLMALIARRMLLAAGITSLAVISLCVGWVAAGQPLPELFHFLVAQEPLISGYSEAMSLHGPFREVLFWAVAAAAITVILYAFVARGRGVKGWLLLVGFGLYAFLTFKEGFVRQDLHQLFSANAFLMTGLFLSALLEARSAIAVAVIASLGWTAIKLSERSATHFSADTVVARFENALKRAVNGVILRVRAADTLPARFERANAAIRAASPLPKVNGTVDLYPDDLSLLFAQGMRWDGRPVIQSYSAYTPGLEEANAAHLLGSHAPENIFFAVDRTDGRLPSLEDGASWPLLLSRYRIVGRYHDYIHMVRAAAPAPLPLGQPLARIPVPINEWVDVPLADGPVWAKIDMRPTLLGRLVLTAFKLPRVSIELRLADGRVVRRRYIPEMGRAGFVLSPYVRSTTDFLMMAAGLYGAHAVRRIKLDAPSLGLWARDITLSLRALRVPPERGLRKLVLIEPASPPAFVSAPKVGAVADCWLDAVDGQPIGSIKEPVVVSGWISLHGWTAPSARRGIGPDATWVSLTAATGKRRFYRAKATKRPDVLAAFKQPAMKDPGFTARLDLSGLSGNRELTIYSVHDNKAFLCR